MLWIPSTVRSDIITVGFGNLSRGANECQSSDSISNIFLGGGPDFLGFVESDNDPQNPDKNGRDVIQKLAARLGLSCLANDDPTVGTSILWDQESWELDQGSVIWTAVNEHLLYRFGPSERFVQYFLSAVFTSKAHPRLSVNFVVGHQPSFAHVLARTMLSHDVLSDISHANTENRIHILARDVNNMLWFPERMLEGGLQDLYKVVDVTHSLEKTYNPLLLEGDTGGLNQLATRVIKFFHGKVPGLNRKIDSICIPRAEIKRFLSGYDWAAYQIPGLDHSFVLTSMLLQESLFM